MNDVIKTIIDQIGGNQTFAMVGAKNISYSNKDNRLTFKFGRAPRCPANTVVITYNQGTDLYDVAFWVITPKKNYQYQELFHGIYADRLRGHFEDVTGLRTSLTKVFALT